MVFCRPHLCKDRLKELLRIALEMVEELSRRNGELVMDRKNGIFPENYKPEKRVN